MRKFISIAVLFLMNTQLFGWSGGFMGASKNTTGNVTITGNLTTTGGITAGTVAAETLSVNSDSLVLTSNAGLSKIYSPAYADIAIYGYAAQAMVTSGYTWTQIFDVAGNGNQSLSRFASISAKLGAFDSTRIGGGATIIKIDTSAAGDSTKLDYINGNRIMHLGTEVKP